MHNNRKIYTLDQYQSILIKRWNSTLIWLGKRNPDGHPELWFARPTPRTLWLPGKPRQKYYRRLYEKLHSTLKISSDKYSFITLTYHTKKYSPDEVAERLKGDIKELLRRLRKKHKNIQYFWIIELTASGYPHIHIIINKFIFWKVLRGIWYAITKSYITDIRSIPAANVASYVCKYLTKQSKHSDWQFQFIFKNIDRIWSSSRGFFGKYIKPVSDCIFLAFSWDCFVFDKYIHRPDSSSEFWYVPYQFAIPLLGSPTYIHRKISDACWEFVSELNSLFDSHLIRDCYNMCDEFYHNNFSF